MFFTDLRRISWRRAARLGVSLLLNQFPLASVARGQRNFVRKDNEMFAAAPPVKPGQDRRHNPSREALLQRVTGEFTEMPCLRLTRGQAQRLFGMSPDVCGRVLATLVSDGTLTFGADERYRLNDSGGWSSRAIPFRPTTTSPPKAS